MHGDKFPPPPGNIHGQPRLSAEKDRVVDNYPPPGGHITDGTAQVAGSSGEHSAINPYTSELSIFKGAEFAKLDRVTKDDFFVGVSAIDGEARYIRKAFVESVSVHNKGCIVRTYSGDFHVLQDDQRVIFDALDSRPGYAHERTERELVKTAIRELTSRVQVLEEDQDD